VSGIAAVHDACVMDGGLGARPFGSEIPFSAAVRTPMRHVITYSQVTMRADAHPVTAISSTKLMYTRQV
jgi:hypothetical protein